MIRSMLLFAVCLSIFGYKNFYYKSLHYLSSAQIIINSHECHFSVDFFKKFTYNHISTIIPLSEVGREQSIAGVAQQVEQLICNQQVVGSSPIASSSALSLKTRSG